MKILTQIAFWLTIIGGLNWGLVGFFGFDLVAGLFGPLSVLARIVYAVVGLSSIWLVINMYSSPKESQ